MRHLKRGRTTVNALTKSYVIIFEDVIYVFSTTLFMRHLKRGRTTVNVFPKHPFHMTYFMPPLRPYLVRRN
jgi:hypothetical protein